MKPCMEPNFNCIALAPEGNSLCVVHQTHPHLHPREPSRSYPRPEVSTPRTLPPYIPTPWDDAHA